MADQRKLNTDLFSRTGQDERQSSLPEPVTDEQWQAIISNDSAFDGQFFYAVKTTGIFCRPSCKSRSPKRENIGFFRTADEAMTAKFRSCKRCKPTGQRLPNEEWIMLVTEYIDRNYKELLTLDKLAVICHGTPYHLHRTFKKIKGITPVDYIHNVRIEKAKEFLHSSNRSIAETGEAVGLFNTPYFITLFKKKTGHTPNGYRKWKQEQMKEEIQNDTLH